MGETRRRGNVISDRESGGHYPLSRHGQYYRPWGHGKGVRLARDSSYGNPRSNPHPRRSDVVGTRGAVARGLRSSTNIDAARGRETPRVWRTSVFRKRNFAVERIPDCPFAIDDERRSCDSIRKKFLLDDGTLGMGGNRLTIESRSRSITEVISGRLWDVQECFGS